MKSQEMACSLNGILYIDHDDISGTMMDIMSFMAQVK